MARPRHRQTRREHVGDRQGRAHLPGHPTAAGFLTRLIGERTKGTEWYEQRFLPRIGPLALYGLLFTIVVLFALQGDAITSNPLGMSPASPCRCSRTSRSCGSARSSSGCASDSHTNATRRSRSPRPGNNFELAIAVAIGVFGVTSGQALAGVVGPLIEVPVLVGLVYVALWARRRFYPSTTVQRPIKETS